MASSGKAILTGAGGAFKMARPPFFDPLEETIQPKPTGAGGPPLVHMHEATGEP